MDNILKAGQIINDPWHLSQQTVDADYAILTPDMLTAQAQKPSSTKLGLLLESLGDVSDVSLPLTRFALIVINIENFADGRFFSLSRELRETHHFQNELRASGNFIVDQLAHMKQVGFDSFAFKDANSAKQALQVYQQQEQRSRYQPMMIEEN